MNRLRVAVLRILNYEHHQESNNGGAGVDDQLPSVGKMKHRPGQRPNDNDQKSEGESPWTAENIGAFAGNDMKGVLHETDEVALVLFCLRPVVPICDSNLSSHFQRGLRA